jgi:hypothetical protein
VTWLNVCTYIEMYLQSDRFGGGFHVHTIFLGTDLLQPLLPLLALLYRLAMMS